MPFDENDAGYLWDMLDAARGIVASMQGVSSESYLADDNLRLATERRIEIIGEAAGRVSDAVREAHPQIPWRQIIAQRHVLAHDYGEIDNDLIWSVTTTHVPQLIALLEKMLPNTPPDAD